MYESEEFRFQTDAGRVVGRSAPEVKRFKGVRYRKDHKRWVAEMKPPKCKNKVWFGEFCSEIEAARVVDVAFHHYGRPLNFPDSTPRLLSSLTTSAGLSAEAKLKLVRDQTKRMKLLLSPDRSTSDTNSELRPFSAIGSILDHDRDDTASQSQSGFLHALMSSTTLKRGFTEICSSANLSESRLVSKYARLTCQEFTLSIHTLYIEFASSCLESHLGVCVRLESLPSSRSFSRFHSLSLFPLTPLVHDDAVSHDLSGWLQSPMSNVGMVEGQETWGVAGRSGDGPQRSPTQWSVETAMAHRSTSDTNSGLRPFSAMGSSLILTDSDEADDAVSQPQPDWLQALMSSVGMAEWEETWGVAGGSGDGSQRSLTQWGVETAMAHDPSGVFGISFEDFGGVLTTGDSSQAMDYGGSMTVGFSAAPPAFQLCSPGAFHMEAADGCWEQEIAAVGHDRGDQF